MTDSLYTVYCLADKCRHWRVRYVGITKQQLSKRLHGHLWDAKRPYRNEHKTNWIRKCIATNLPIHIRSVRGNLTLADACQLERELIARYRIRLVNIHEGGSSGYAGLPPDAKARHLVNTRAALALIPIEKRRAIILAASAKHVEMASKKRAAYIRSAKHLLTLRLSGPRWDGAQQIVVTEKEGNIYAKSESGLHFFSSYEAFCKAMNRKLWRSLM